MWKIFRRVLFVSVPLAILGEVFCRFVLGLGTPPLSVTHPTIEYMFLPNQNISRFRKRQSYNRFSMRSEDFDKERGRSREFRIMVFGDSVINGGNLTAQKDLATALVDREIERSREFDQVIVGNISAGSWGPGNQLAYVEEFGFFDADIIILVISSHDYYDIPKFGDLNPKTHPTSMPPSALIEGFQRYLPRYLPSFSSPIVNSKNSESLVPTETTADDLRQLLTMAKASSSRVKVIQYLSREEITSGKLDPGYSKIRTICEELGILPLSTKEQFTNAVTNGQNPFRDGIHPNDLGQKLLSTTILEAIQIQD